MIIFSEHVASELGYPGLHVDVKTTNPVLSTSAIEGTISIAWYDHWTNLDMPVEEIFVDYVRAYAQNNDERCHIEISKHYG